MYIYFKMYENILRINEAKKLLKNFYVLYKFINIYCNQIVILLYIMIRNGQHICITYHLRKFCVKNIQNNK